MRGRFSAEIVSEYVHRGQLSFYVHPDSIVKILTALRDEKSLRFDYLADICSVDHLRKKAKTNERYEVVYNIVSIPNSFRMFVRIRVSAEAQKIPTLCNEWPCANWLEREVWDMMGIEFKGHPNLTKIVTADDLEGHPLRKDFGIKYEIQHFTHTKDDPIEVVPDNPFH